MHCLQDAFIYGSISRSCTAKQNYNSDKCFKKLTKYKSHSCVLRKTPRTEDIAKFLSHIFNYNRQIIWNQVLIIQEIRSRKEIETNSQTR